MSYCFVHLAGEGKYDEIELALKIDRNLIYNRDKDGCSALLKAAENGYNDIVSLLISYSADVNIPKYYGYTALMIAAKNGHEESVKTLVSNNANINASNKYGHTALLFAAQHGRKNEVEIFLINDANVNAKNNVGDTALILAAYGGHENIIRMLIDSNADVNARNMNGYTALISTAQNGLELATESLIRNNADLNVQHNIYGSASSILHRSFQSRSCVFLSLNYSVRQNFLYFLYGCQLISTGTVTETQSEVEAAVTSETAAAVSRSTVGISVQRYLGDPYTIRALLEFLHVAFDLDATFECDLVEGDYFSGPEGDY